MKQNIEQKLDSVLQKICEDDFLHSRRLGGEIAFYIFEYDPQHELDVRKHVENIKKKLPFRRPDLKFLHVNIFEFLISYLKEKELLEKSYELQNQKGDKELWKALKAVLKEEKIAQEFERKFSPSSYDLVFITGIGNAYPLLRSHSLLNNLHARMGKTILILFFPGHYDSQSLRLFGKLNNDHYYRAFKLIA